MSLAGDHKCGTADLLRCIFPEGPLNHSDASFDQREHALGWWLSDVSALEWYVVAFVDGDLGKQLRRVRARA
jgi:hypothetical protein